MWAHEQQGWYLTAGGAQFYFTIDIYGMNVEQRQRRPHERTWELQTLEAATEKAGKIFL